MLSSSVGGEERRVRRYSRVESNEKRMDEKNSEEKSKKKEFSRVSPTLVVRPKIGREELVKEVLETPTETVK